MVEDLESLRVYVRGSGNYMMDSLEDFDRKVKLIIELWPQIKDNSIRYLIGKGVGCELALRGQIDREHRDIDFSYRSHADLEFYGVSSDNYLELEDARDFHYVFGNQELYTPDEMKSLHDLDSNLLFSTCEHVSYNGNEYLIPELELLFLDKYLRVENNPRREGFDYELLLQKYDLSLDKILSYFDKYYLEPVLADFKDGYDGLLDTQLNGIIQLVDIAVSDIGENQSSVSLDEIVDYVNNRIKMVKESNVMICGLRSDLIEYDPPIREENGKYIIDDYDYINKICNNIKNFKENDKKCFFDKRKDIIKLFERR